MITLLTPVLLHPPSLPPTLTLNLSRTHTLRARAAFDIPDRVLGSALGRHDGNVYEALFEQALHSELNPRTNGSADADADADAANGPSKSTAFPHAFEGYEEFLRPHLDLEFLALRNGLLPEAAEARREAEEEAKHARARL